MGQVVEDSAVGADSTIISSTHIKVVTTAAIIRGLIVTIKHPFS